MNNEKDKNDCFAWINKDLCNALNEKKCENCSFYKNKNEVPNYTRFLTRGKKELLSKKAKNK